ITLETARYGSFDEFEEQLQLVIAAAAATIDSDFFTRVGLRYVNVLPCQASSIDGWLNDQLAQPLRMVFRTHSVE
ncbi:TIGR04255 family protein, partial [Escherichia coli]|uniref:TIGR04255 family protein n=1 Tax=Escherichia coli TaxID=562 RepID=UPI003C0E4F89